MKSKVRALMLMLLMCWASLSSAQPTRAVRLTQDSVEIIQKATPLKKLPRFDYLIKTCEVALGNTARENDEVKERVENIYRLKHNYSFVYDRMNQAQTYLFPSSMIHNSLLAQNKHIKEEGKKEIDESVEILQLPKHGKLVIDERVRSELDIGSFGYIPDLNFEGDDKVVFSAKYHGKNYKVVMNLRVRYDYISDSSEGIELASSLCANTYKYIKLADASSKIIIGSTD